MEPLQVDIASSRLETTPFREGHTCHGRIPLCSATTQPKKAESPVAESLTPVGGRPLHSPALDLQQPLSVNYRTALILQNRCAADAQAAQSPAGGGAQFGGGRETGGAGVEVALRRQAPRH